MNPRRSLGCFLLGKEPRLAKVIFYFKDPGGTANGLPVAKRLQELGDDVTCYTEGKASEILVKEKLRHVPLTKGVHEMDFSSNPDLFVTSMCSGGGSGRDAAEVLRGKCRTVALQDFPGARLLTDWKPVSFRPDYMVVNDNAAAQIVRDAWSEKIPTILVSGYPSLDALHGYPIEAKNVTLRSRFGIGKRDFVVMFAGQVGRTGMVMEEVCAAMNMLQHATWFQKIWFVPRYHPRMMTDAKEEAAKWSTAHQSLNRKIQVLDTQVAVKDVSIMEVLAMSSVAVSAFSTTLQEAAVFRKDAIAMLSAEAGQKQFLEETGGVMKEYPLVTLGCVKKATTSDECYRLLNQSMRGGLGIERAQKNAFFVDGKNADRLARTLQALAYKKEAR